MLSLFEQYQTAWGGVTSGDLDLISKVLTDPDAISPNEHRTFAEKMGFKDGWLSAGLNLVTDPTIWVAAILSRKFPTSGFLTGVIPHRFIGAANEFSGLSTIGRTVEGFFRGTNIPKLSALAMRRRQQVLEVGNKIFDRLLERPTWTSPGSKDMEIVSLLLEGRPAQGATPELKNLADDVRKHMNELWGFLAKTQKVSGGLDSKNYTFASSRSFTPSEAPRYLRDYLPHIPLTGPESLIELDGLDAIKRLVKGPQAQVFSLTGEDPTRVWNLTQQRTLVSTWEQYQRFMDRVGTQVFNPRLFRRLRSDLSLGAQVGGKDIFITDLNVILQRYIDSVARTYALNAPLSAEEIAISRSLIEKPGFGVSPIYPTSEPIVVQVINEGLRASGTPKLIRKPILGSSQVEEYIDPKTLNAPTLGALKNLVRELRGQSDIEESLFGNLMNSIRTKVANKVAPLMGKRKTDELEASLSALERRQKDRRFSNGLVSYFYATTLGLNPAAALKNLFQPFLTTVPSIGLGPTLQGYRVLRERLPSYFSSIRRHHGLLQVADLNAAGKLNVSIERAFHDTFPELGKSGIRVDPRYFEFNEADLVTDRSGKKGFPALDHLWRVMLQPFTQAESANQIVTFYGGKQALREAVRRKEMSFPATPEGVPLAGKDFEEFLDFEASSLVNSLQFRPGPGSRTPLQAMIPAPLRMFTGFPVRLGNFFSESTVRGAMLDSQLKESGNLTRILGGRNLGTLARVYLSGRVVTESLRETLGVDMGDALGITGPYTNVLTSGRLFAPLPIAPIPGVALALASFTSTRDLRSLQPITLPLVGDVPVPRTLVPGGITMTRAVRALNSFRPDLGGFVDEDERLMYQGDTSDLMFSILGIPLDKERRMRERIDELESLRLRVRKHRREYAVASRNYDSTEMDRLEKEFKVKFPDFPALAISRQDRRRYDENARMTSVQRTLTSLGKAGKFLEEDFYEYEPDLLAR